MGTSQAKPQTVHGSEVEISSAARKNGHAIAEHSQPSQAESEEVVPYVMHVSSRYLELTQKKLSYTRLPREVEVPERKRWELGTPKGVLEPLLDYWIESYDWRTQEARFNKALPQYRTTVRLNLPSSPSLTPTRPKKAQSPPDLEAQQLSSLEAGAKTSGASTTHDLRIHFAHKPSKHAAAIPLLFIHDYPASFIEVQKVIDASTDPALPAPGLGGGGALAFHVVAPSVPGSGFGDAGDANLDNEGNGFGIWETAESFDLLMQRLGYGSGYVVHGSGWGFRIARALALRHPSRCLAIHTTNPTFSAPVLTRNPLVWMKYNVATWTKGKVFGFGYTPEELKSAPYSEADSLQEPPIQGPTSNGTLWGGVARPHTTAFSLCDSPVGLLAGMLDMLHTPHTTSPTSRSTASMTTRPRSPFLDPEELELEERQASNATTGDGTATGQPGSVTANGDGSGGDYTWTPTEVLNWTMLQWLPGPEASLRWLRRATLDTAPATPFANRYCPVPLGISEFRPAQREGSKIIGRSPLMWGSATHNIAWMKRHSQQRRALVSPAWEAPDLVVLDMRECFGALLSSHPAVATAVAGTCV